MHALRFAVAAALGLVHDERPRRDRHEDRRVQAGRHRPRGLPGLRHRRAGQEAGGARRPRLDGRRPRTRRRRAEKLAKMGYVAFAADIYGKGVRPATRQGGGGRWPGPTTRTARSCAPGCWPGSTSWRASPTSTRSGSPPSATASAATTVLELARAGADVGRRGVLPRRPRQPDAGRREEHQGQDARPPRRRRSRSSPAAEVAAFEDEMRGDRRRLAARGLRRRRPRLHHPGGRQRQLEGQRPTTPAPTGAAGRRWRTSSPRSSRRASRSPRRGGAPRASRTARRRGAAAPAAAQGSAAFQAGVRFSSARRASHPASARRSASDAAEGLVHAPVDAPGAAHVLVGPLRVSPDLGPEARAEGILRLPAGRSVAGEAEAAHHLLAPRVDVG